MFPLYKTKVWYPTYFLFCVKNVDIKFSRISQTEPYVVFLLLLFEYSTAEINTHRGSLYLLISSFHMWGMYLLICLNIQWGMTLFMLKICIRLANSHWSQIFLHQSQMLALVIIIPNHLQNLKPKTGFIKFSIFTSIILSILGKMIQIKFFHWYK